MNEKVRATKRLYSKERKKRRVLEIKKKVTGLLKIMEKEKGYAEKSREKSTDPTLALRVKKLKSHP
jgi:hypothetical protein